MKINILGLGWFGEPLAKALMNQGHEVKGSCRTTEKQQNLFSKNISSFTLNYPDLPSEELLNAGVIVLNIPPFAEELAWWKSWNINPETWIIFISSTSNSPLLLEQEKWIQETFHQWTILRFGGLIGGGRHPGKHLSGRKNLPGRLWPVNLIHQDDVVSFTNLVITKKIQKEIIDVVSDEHPTREEFYSDYCQSQNLPLPEFSPEDHSVKLPISNDRLKHYYSVFTSLKNL
jgi:nucleoside-diphosphate-sugar epimerase